LDGIIMSARWRIEESLEEIIKTANTGRFYANRVIIFGPIVEYDQALPRIIARAIATNRDEATFAERHRLSGTEEIDRRLSAALQGGPIEYVSVYRALCAEACELWATKQVPLQFDNSHLTCEGSIELARRIGPQLFRDITPEIARPEGCAGEGRRIDGPVTASGRRAVSGPLPEPSSE
jgi:SGNH domain (fused to AT3 domains)